MNKSIISTILILTVATIATVGSQNLVAFTTTEKYIASLAGQNEVPPVQTNATDTAGFSAPHFNNITFGLSVNNIDQVTGAY